MTITKTDKEIIKRLINEAEKRASKALSLGNEVSHRIHMDRADVLRKEIK